MSFINPNNPPTGHLGWVGSGDLRYRPHGTAPEHWRIPIKPRLAAEVEFIRRHKGVPPGWDAALGRSTVQLEERHAANRKKPFGCGHAAGIANGRPGEKLVRPGIFVRLDRTRQMLGRRSGIRGGFAAKK